MGFVEKFKRQFSRSIEQDKDDEYKLPALSPLPQDELVMTSELRSRKANEELCLKYGISLPKEGEFK